MKLVFFDIETGGLDSAIHPITQIAAIAVDENLQPIEEVELKLIFNPDECDPVALTKNSYDKAVWAARAIPSVDACDQLSAFFKRYADVQMISKSSGKPYRVAQLIGHNADRFDGPFLQGWYKGMNAFMPAAFSVMCTYQRAMHYFYEKPDCKPPENLKLATLCEYFGIELTNAHDALSDVRANVDIYRHLIGKA